MHGRLSPIQHDESALFAGLPQDFLAVRYHSLVVGAVPAELRVSAWTPDGVVMGLEHRTRPLFGVQFHPESVSTRHGRRLIENFRDLTARGAPRAVARPRRAQAPAAGQVGARVHHRRLETWWSPRRCSAPSTATMTTRSGSTARPRAGPGAVLVRRRPRRAARRGRALRRRDALARRRAPLGAELRRGACSTTAATGCPPAGRCPRAALRLTCGFAGYLGFELKAECGAAGAQLAAAGRGARALRPADRLRSRRAPRLPARARRPSGAEAARAWLPRPRSAWARSHASRRRCRRPRPRPARSASSSMTPRRRTWPTSPPAGARSSRARPTRSA